MPRLTKETPGPLRPFAFHGVDLSWADGSDQAAADCPFCGKRKFFASVTKGLWDCKVCGLSGNSLTFVRRVWDDSDRATSPGTLARALSDRGLLSNASALLYGARASALDGGCVLPGYDADGKLCNLYRYAGVGNGKRALLATPGLEHGLHVPEAAFGGKAGTYYVCEGSWDAMVLREALGMARRRDDGALVQTANPGASLLADAEVVAVPGCNVWKDQWARVLAGRRVVLCFDSDHPRPHPTTGAPTPPAGREGARRLALALAAASDPPASVHWVAWGPDGYDPALKAGYDVRDAIAAGGSDVPARLRGLSDLLDRVEPIPQEWVPGRTAAVARAGSVEVRPEACSDWRTLTTACRKAMKWTEGLDRAMSFVLSVILSTPADGDQLWGTVISPPSTGKSTLCEAVSVARDWVVPKDTMTGLFSGFQVDDAGKENLSLATRLDGKTLVIKDADTVVQAPNREQILSQFRALYDRNVRTTYKNKMSRDYENLASTVIIAGTDALYALDAAELGARFLTCRVMNGVDSALEEEVGTRIAYRVLADLGVVLNGSGPVTGGDAEMVRMKRLTGGYVEHLRRNWRDLLSGVSVPHEALDECRKLGKLVAFMRARPSSRQAESVEREFSARLVSQMVRLAACMTAVLCRPAADDEVMRRVRRTAHDTCHGSVFDLTAHLYRHPEDGLPAANLALLGNMEVTAMVHLLRFLRKIKAVEYVETSKGGRLSKRWRLSPDVLQLYYDTVAKHPAT